MSNGSPVVHVFRRASPERTPFPWMRPGTAPAPLENTSHATRIQREKARANRSKPKPPEPPSSSPLPPRSHTTATRSRGGASGEDRGIGDGTSAPAGVKKKSAVPFASRGCGHSLGQRGGQKRRRQARFGGWRRVQPLLGQLAWQGHWDLGTPQPQSFDWSSDVVTT
jgi:hypothetical protein